MGGNGGGNVEPRGDDPAASGVETPEIGSHHAEDGSGDHEEDFILEMGIFVAQDPEELSGEENRESTHKDADNEEQPDDLQVASP